jgi:bifunctional DNA-binding transcriptional regulator/antitoxin component of YhaV-PrlF toxin-antitoxin module
MIESIQKVIKIGSSGGVTIPAKEMKRQGIKFGDEVKVIVTPAQEPLTKDDQHVLNVAKQILKEYKQDFENLAKR